MKAVSTMNQVGESRLAGSDKPDERKTAATGDRLEALDESL
jgi:hypothetical protein